MAIRAVTGEEGPARILCAMPFSWIGGLLAVTGALHEPITLLRAPMLREGPLDIAMTNVPDGFPAHRTMSETAGGFALTDIAIVAEDGEPVPDGATGELLIRGVGVMAGGRHDRPDPDPAQREIQPEGTSSARRRGRDTEPSTPRRWCGCAAGSTARSVVGLS